MLINGNKGTRRLSIGLAFWLILTFNSSYGIELKPLAQPGNWSGVSSILGYQNKIWFVNSEKFRNHNSADIYTYDLETKRTHYQRSLFSQDAGDPVVANGLLYWPHEDARFSAGRGEFMVTNGQNWRVNMLPQGQAFHVHTLIAKDTPGS